MTFTNLYSLCADVVEVLLGQPNIELNQQVSEPLNTTSVLFFMVHQTAQVLIWPQDFSNYDVHFLPFTDLQQWHYQYMPGKSQLPVSYPLPSTSVALCLMHIKSWSILLSEWNLFLHEEICAHLQVFPNDLVWITKMLIYKSSGNLPIASDVGFQLAEDCRDLCGFQYV